MIRALRNIVDYRELLAVLTWKNIVIRYKQSYLGLAWVILRPLVMVGIFMIVRGFVGIDSGDVPYALLTYCAMVPWVFLQDGASEGVTSVVNNAALIRKIYFPREIFPLAAVLTKLLDLSIGLCILGLMMYWFGYGLTPNMLWAPLILVYAAVTTLTISLIGAALNVYARDMSYAIPLLLSLLMYLSPVIYPMALVREQLVDRQLAGPWSDTLYFVYTLNPVAGIIDGFQRVMLMNQHPDPEVLLPGLLLTLTLLPLSYLFFKRAEAFFADVI